MSVEAELEMKDDRFGDDFHRLVEKVATKIFAEKMTPRQIEVMWEEEVYSPMLRRAVVERMKEHYRERLSDGRTHPGREPQSKIVAGKDALLTLDQLRCLRKNELAPVPCYGTCSAGDFCEHPAPPSQTFLDCFRENYYWN